MLYDLTLGLKDVQKTKNREGGKCIVLEHRKPICVANIFGGWITHLNLVSAISLRFWSNIRLIPIKDFAKISGSPHLSHSMLRNASAVE